jgi:hypothetical protein
MDTISVLNHYRLLLANDPLTFRMLSHCFAHGPSTEQEIETDELPLAEINARIIKLFRANLLKRAGKSHWATTELANALLSKMGVARRATEWLVESTALDQDDQTFLKASIRLADEEDFWASAHTHSLCSMLLNVFGEIGKNEKTAEEKDETLFSAIVGLDSRAEALGAEGYVDALYSYLASSKPAKRKQLVKKVESSIENARASNRLLMTADASVGKSTFVLTWARMLNATLTGRPDAGMECLASRASANVDDVWSSLKTWKRDLTSCSRRLLFVADTADTENPDEAFLEQLKSTLQALQKQQHSRWIVVTRNSDYLLGHAFKSCPQENADTIIRTLKDSHENGNLALLNPQAKENLCKSMDEYAILYRQTLLGRVNNAGPNKPMNPSG